VNAIRRLSPFYTPAYATTRGEFFKLRERLLQAILLIFIAMSVPVFYLASRQTLLGHPWLVVAVYAGLYAFAIPVFILRERSYFVRATIMASIVYVMAVIQVMESGEMGDTGMFLIAYAALCALLFDYRSVVVANILSVFTMIGMIVYVQNVPHGGVLVIERLREGSDWVTASATFLMASSVISGAMSFILAGLSTSLNQQEKLAKTLENERVALEERIKDRTESIAHQVSQLHAAADVSRTISALSDPETLLQQVVNLVKERFNLYYAGIFLLDSSRQFAVLQAGTGEAGRKMISLGHQLATGGASMIGWSISNREARIALDVGAEAVRFNNPHLPKTRSEMALPIITRDTVLGAITVQSDQPNAFDANDIVILKSIADSLGVALENNRLYQQTRASLEEIRSLNREYLQRTWTQARETYGELAYTYQNPTMSSAEEGTQVEIPLLLRQEPIGSIVLELDRDTLSADEKRFLESVTTQTAIALENARLLNETERSAMQEQKLNEISTRFSRALSIEEILRAAALELGQLPNVAEISVMLDADSRANHPLAQNPIHAGQNGKERGK
jgi:GAF domain-containing protein